MPPASDIKVVVVGGSAGSFPVVTFMLANLKKDIPFALVLCLHRLKHFKNGFSEALNIKTAITVIEPEDKQIIKPGNAYLAPANYHLCAEIGQSFALSTEETRNFSRPSIDISFESFSDVYQEKMIGIILSGANTDGCVGLRKCKLRGGFTIVQDPAEAVIKTMVEGTLKIFTPDLVANTNQIVKYLNNL